jgi:hypothetical protein|tara:strand:+ start:17 stop:403 length:387 start_codon:yes stop_codon:yes gene_type:complete
MSFNSPTPEQLSKIENYLKEYLKLYKEFGQMYDKSVEIPFGEFFEGSENKYHLTMIEDENFAARPKHCIQTNERFMKKLENYKNTENFTGEGKWIFTLTYMRKKENRELYARLLFKHMATRNDWDLNS